jgi:hypothetical protein
MDQDAQSGNLYAIMLASLVTVDWTDEQVLQEAQPKAGSVYD